MPTTMARKLRRQQMKTQKELIESFLQAYVEDPGKALNTCFQKFGRQKFEKTLQQYVTTHSIKSALSLTLHQCLGEKHDTHKTNVAL